MNLADVEEARKGMSKAEFEQEYEASFVTFEGQIYEAFSEEHIEEGLTERMAAALVSNRFKYDVIMGVDPGYKDDTAGLILVYDTEYSENERTTAQHALEFDTVFKKWDVDMCFIDAAAAQFRQDLNVMYDIPSNAAIKSVLDGIAYVQTLIEQNKLRIDSRCEKTILMLKNYRWDPNDKLVKPRPLHDAFSHLADALRYALYSMVR